MSTRNFFEYDPASEPAQSWDYSVLPVPYERSTSYSRGTAAAPQAIIRAGGQLELFDEELWAEPRLRARALPAVDCSGPRRTVFERIRRAASAELAKGRFVLALGGEHTITFPLAQAAMPAAGPLTVLSVDAHADLRGEYLGDRWSHACVMRRVREAGAATVHLGLRSLCAEEADYIGRCRIPVFRALEMAGDGGAMERDAAGLLASLEGRVYVSVDVDAFDPAVFPLTGTPEPGGLGWRQMLRMLRAVFASCDVAAADIVETIPAAGSALPEYAAARLAAKLMAYHALRRGGTGSA